MGSVDANPFRRVVLNLLLRAELVTYDDTILPMVQDFLWYRLALSLSSRLVGAPFTLSDLANIVDEYGSEHFDPRHVNPYNFAQVSVCDRVCTVSTFDESQVLLLVQRYPAAVDYVATYGPSGQCDAVHMALALEYYGVLDTGHEPGGMALTREGAVNVTGLIEQHMRLLQGHTKVAADYAACVRNDAARHALLVDVLLAGCVCGDGALFELVGSDRDVEAPAGYFYERLPRREVEDVLRDAARQAKEAGRSSDAFKLYVRSGVEGSADAAGSVVCEALAAALVPPNAARDVWLTRANEIFSKASMMLCYRTACVPAAGYIWRRPKRNTHAPWPREVFRSLVRIQVHWHWLQ